MAGYVNITIATFNRVECTEQCIQSIIERTSYPYTLNIIDNGSSDGTKKYLKGIQRKPEYAERINRIVMLDRNMGISPAYNLGWTLSDAPYYMKVDNDVVFLRDDWLQTLIDAANIENDIAMVGFGKNTCGLRHKENDSLYYQGHVGGCTLIKREAHKRIGFWNEDYGLYGEEDADYGLRARLAGFSNVTCSDERGDFIKYVAKLDTNFDTYTDWKKAERESNLKEIFLLNDVLFKCGFRDVYVDRKFLPVDIDGRITFRLNKDYILAFEMLKNKYSPILKALVESDEMAQINNELGLNIHY